MPTYDYQCEECGHVFEAFHGISQKPLKDCPKCHKSTLKRGIGGQNAVLRFKGSGFYITDYNGSKETQKSDTQSSTSKSQEKS